MKPLIGCTPKPHGNSRLVADGVAAFAERLQKRGARSQAAS